MGAIINFKPQRSAKLDFKRARRRKKKRDHMERYGQLNLFSSKQPRILRLDSGLSLFEQALMLDDRGDPTAADRYRMAVEQGDYPADSLCNLGIIESSNGNRSKAFDCFTRSLTLEPRHFESHYNLGNLYFDISDYSLARTHYEFAMEVNPGYANLYYNLGLVLALEKQYKRAVEVLNQFASMSADEEESAKARQLVARIVDSAAMDGT